MKAFDDARDHERLPRGLAPWGEATDPEAEAAAAAFAGTDPTRGLLWWAAWQTGPPLPPPWWPLAHPEGFGDRSIDAWSHASIAIVLAVGSPADGLIATAASALLEHGGHSPPPAGWRRILGLLPRWFQALAALVADEPLGPIDPGVGSVLVAAHAHGNVELAAAAWSTLPSHTRTLPYDLRLAGGHPPLPPEAFSPRGRAPRCGNVIAAAVSMPAIGVKGLSFGPSATSIVERCAGQLHLAGRGEGTRCGIDRGHVPVRQTDPELCSTPWCPHCFA